MRHVDEGTGEHEYWFCLKHHAVEDEHGCRGKDRLGPYPTAQEAARALEKVAERNEEWENDPAWNDDVAEEREDD